MSYRSLGSDEVTLRNYRPVGRRKGNMSLSDPLAAGVVVDLHKPGLSGIRIRLPRRRLISARYFIKKSDCPACPGDSWGWSCRAERRDQALRLFGEGVDDVPAVLFGGRNEGTDD